MRPAPWGVCRSVLIALYLTGVGCNDSLAGRTSDERASRRAHEALMRRDTTPVPQTIDPHWRPEGEVRP